MNKESLPNDNSGLAFLPPEIIDTNIGKYKGNKRYLEHLAQKPGELLLVMNGVNLGSESHRSQNFRRYLADHNTVRYAIKKYYRGDYTDLSNLSLHGLVLPQCNAQANQETVLHGLLQSVSARADNYQETYQRIKNFASNIGVFFTDEERHSMLNEVAFLITQNIVDEYTNIPDKKEPQREDYVSLIKQSSDNKNVIHDKFTGSYLQVISVLSSVRHLQPPFDSVEDGFENALTHMERYVSALHSDQLSTKQKHHGWLLLRDIDDLNRHQVLVSEKQAETDSSKRPITISTMLSLTEIIAAVGSQDIKLRALDILSEYYAIGKAISPLPEENAMLTAENYHPLKPYVEEFTQYEIDLVKALKDKDLVDLRYSAPNHDIAISELKRGYLDLSDGNIDFFTLAVQPDFFSASGKWIYEQVVDNTKKQLDENSIGFEIVEVIPGRYQHLILYNSEIDRAKLFNNTFQVIHQNLRNFDITFSHSASEDDVINWWKDYIPNTNSSEFAKFKEKLKTLRDEAISSNVQFWEIGDTLVCNQESYAYKHGIEEITFKQSNPRDNIQIEMRVHGKAIRFEMDPWNRRIQYKDGLSEDQLEWLESVVYPYISELGSLDKKEAQQREISQDRKKRKTTVNTKPYWRLLPITYTAHKNDNDEGIIAKYGLSIDEINYIFELIQLGSDPGDRLSFYSDEIPNLLLANGIETAYHEAFLTQLRGLLHDVGFSRIYERNKPEVETRLAEWKTDRRKHRSELIWISPEKRETPPTYNLQYVSGHIEQGYHKPKKHRSNI